MKINPLMFLKHFDCQRNAPNYINNATLKSRIWIVSSKSGTEPRMEQGGNKTFNSCFLIERDSSYLQNKAKVKERSKRNKTVIALPVIII